MEGLHCYNAVTCDATGLTLPAAEYDHSQGECSITGGMSIAERSTLRCKGYIFSVTTAADASGG